MSGAGTRDPGLSNAPELARAARILAIRSRRAASGLFSGSYASAFRGGGMVFEESRPYVPGDDVRNMDWNAMARTGEPFVKRFRDERDRMILLVLDVSSSMAFGTGDGGRPGSSTKEHTDRIQSKAMVGAHTAALIAAAAGRAGDRVGFISFAEQVHNRLAPARGPAHTWQVIRTAMASAREPRGGTDLAAAIEALRGAAVQDAIVVMISDFRDAAPGEGGGHSKSGTRTEEASGLERHAPRDARERDPAGDALSSIADRHDMVSIVVHDRRDEFLPRVGQIRLEDPEHPGSTLLLDTGSAAVRDRYHASCRQRRRDVERALRRAGSDVLWMRTDRDPLQALIHFFHERAAHVRSRAV